jgi:HD-like signal output (HDOD) protein
MWSRTRRVFQQPASEDIHPHLTRPARGGGRGSFAPDGFSIRNTAYRVNDAIDRHYKTRAQVTQLRIKCFLYRGDNTVRGRGIQRVPCNPLAVPPSQCRIERAYTPEISTEKDIMPAIGSIQKAEEIADRVKDLPSLPVVLQKLIMVLEDMRSSAKDIERIVATDPALTARILKLANSPLYKRAEPVATISQAVTLLGFWKLRDVVISVGATETLSEMASEKIQQDYWHHAVYTATCANILATKAGLPVPEETFVTGLLHDIGELVLAAVSPEQFALLQEIDPQNRLAHEEELFGATHPRIGTMLLRQWLLPKPLCDAVRLHHTEKVYTSRREPVISAVALSDMLGKVHCIGSEPNCSAQTLFLLIKRAGVEIDQIAEVLRLVDNRVSDTQKHLEIAGDVSFLTPTGSSRNYKVAVVSSEPSMVAWLQQLLTYFGHTTIPLQDFFETPEEADLVILDPEAVTLERWTKMEPVLEQMRKHLVVLDSGTETLPGTLQEWNLPEISLFLTQDEIKRYAKARV